MFRSKRFGLNADPFVFSFVFVPYVFLYFVPYVFLYFVPILKVQLGIFVSSVTRNYGSISVPDGAREGPTNYPEVDDEVIVPEVAITVTPATPRVSVVHPVGGHSAISTIIEEESLETNGTPATANHSVTLEADISTTEETPDSIIEAEGEIRFRNTYVLPSKNNSMLGLYSKHFNVLIFCV